MKCTGIGAKKVTGLEIITHRELIEQFYLRSS